MKYLYALFVIGIISLFVLSGCAQKQLVGGDVDEYGCKASAGYSWCEYKQKCLRTFEEPCEHVCTEEESLATACTLEYAPVCGKTVLNVGETVYQTFGNGCSACAAMKVVSYTQGECPTS